MKIKIFLTLLLLAHGLHAKTTTVKIGMTIEGDAIQVRYDVIFSGPGCKNICKQCSSLATGDSCSYEWQPNQNAISIQVIVTTIIFSKTKEKITDTYLYTADLQSNDFVTFPINFSKISSKSEDLGDKGKHNLKKYR